MRAPSTTPPAEPDARTAADAAGGSPRKGRLFTWPLLIGIVVTAGLVATSLFIGVYDIFGAEDGAEMQQGLKDDPFFRFFRGVPGLRMQPCGAQPFRGQGSGFIISPGSPWAGPRPGGCGGAGAPPPLGCGAPGGRALLPP